MSGITSILGLIFDLIGVMILGFDVLAIQRHEKTSASTNKLLLEEAFEGGGSLDYIQTNVEDGSYSEGLFEGHGEVDLGALTSSLRDLAGEIETTGKGLSKAIDYLNSSVEEQSKAAKRSLSLTYWGLGLIVIGFTLQIAGLILGNPKMLEGFN